MASTGNHALAEFTDVYLRRTPPEHLESVGEDHLVAEAAGLFQFASGKGEGGALVRVVDSEQGPGSVVEVVVDDSPFLVDSVTGEILDRGLGIAVMIHPVLGVVRGDDGHIEAIEHARGSAHRESMQHYELDRTLDAEEAEDLEVALLDVLDDVRRAVRDFAKLRGCVGHMIHLATRSGARYDQEQIDESIAFLEWLLDDNFVFLGYREYQITPTPAGDAIQVTPGSGLGILSDVSDSVLAEPVLMVDMPAHKRARYEKGYLLVVSKANSFSTVHRRVRMDYVGLRVIDSEGRVAGEARLLGLFTSRAYMAEVETIPLLRQKLAHIISSEDLIEGSHDYKATVQLFNSFPIDELFTTPDEDIRETVVGLLEAEERSDVRIFVRPDHLARSVSVMVSMPRDVFTPDLRRTLQDLLLERYTGSSIDYRLALSEGDNARLHFTIWIEGGVIPPVPLEELEQEVLDLCRTWDDLVIDLLTREWEPDAARRLVALWSPRLPDYYKSSTSVAIAAGDLLRLDTLAAGADDIVIGLQQEPGPGDVLTRLSVYSKKGRLDLSDMLPVLEALGLRVLESVPTRLGHVDESIFIHDFGVLGSDGGPLNLDACRDRVVETVRASLEGEAEYDSLNRLVVASGFDHREVGILRAYRKYWRRVAPSFTADYTNDAFAEHPGISRMILDLFRARFAPDGTESEEAALRSGILEALDAVRSLDQDRILRGFVGLIGATVRTNAFNPTASCLAIKLRSADVPDMPDPKPLYEIFVYAPEVEGIHLRGGMVARGGIRWSDRLEDYRSEVLGLMKAQLTKNAIIVPTGAKGGFVVRRIPGEHEDPANLGRSAYVTFIRGLLDVTDNIVGGQVIHPAHVRIHDDDDPYLVVAADRGTATFSDTANAIAAEYDFWLGDAFASGGSIGYDHKALAITARGAWESVKRHFSDLDADIEATPFTVVGIGDMSGDVFGNGMLQSRQIRLVAAFDHRHIFLDPDPDPLVSFNERQRLFGLPRSSWDDYDRSLISPGGGVWSRAEKKITLAPEAQAALGTEDETFTPAGIIHAILMAPVDLVWNGGIGTYVKASAESHAAVADHANDSVRINGRQLRCRVFGEGGNLGLTQLGRIEFSRHGGRINTDFIDNSGGVDCSDREVNLKILLRIAAEKGEITEAERVALIAEVAVDVTDRVVEDNFRQAAVISKDEHDAKQRLESYEDLMVVLEREVGLDRSMEYLPDPEEMAERVRDGIGLTRPELAVLMAYTKRQVRRALLASDLPDRDGFRDHLLTYFPDKVVEHFGHLVDEHRLRREIISTSVANHIINSQGITFMNRMMTQTGAAAADVVEAYRIARELTGAERRAEDIENLDGGLDEALRRRLARGVDTLVEGIARWYLGHPSVASMRDRIDRATGGFAELVSAITTVGPPDWRADHQAKAAKLVSRGVPEDIARRHAFQPELTHGPDILEIAEQTGLSTIEVAKVFFKVGGVYRIDWLEQLTDQLPTDTRWRRWGTEALEDDLLLLRRQLVTRILAEAEGVTPAEVVSHYRKSRAEAHSRLDEFFRTMQRDGGGDHAAILVALRQVRVLVG